MKSSEHRRQRLIIAVLLVAGYGWLARAQQTAPPAESEDYTRQLWNTQFQNQRPPSKTPPAPAKSAPESTSVARGVSPAATVDEALVGVTIWKLRASQPSDDQSIRMISKTSGQQWTPVRVNSNLPLAEGELVRVSIEAARSGYLYVIDREQYADGTLGAPYLIFPTLRLNAGDNAVRGGRVIEIPAWDDSPPYFTMRRSRQDQKAEMLTVLVSQNPLQELKIDRDPLKLDPAQVDRWVKQWGAKVQQLESRSAANAAYTKSEKEAGADHTRLLTHEEPLPDNDYKIESKPGDPILLDVPLQIAQ